MKKLTALISVLALLLSLCACSSASEGTPSAGVSKDPAASQAVSDNPVQNSEPVDSPPSDPVNESDAPGSGGEPSSFPAVESDAPGTGGELSSDERKAIAESLIDHPVSELYEAIGEPISSDYAPGCVGDVASEDGELIYDGFTVYTVRTADREEYVYDVL